MQRTARAFVLAFAVEPIGNVESVGIDFDDGPKLRPLAIQRVDAGQVELGEPPRIPAPRTKSAGEIGDRKLIEFERRVPHGLLLITARCEAGGEHSSSESAAIHFDRSASFCSASPVTRKIVHSSIATAPSDL